MVGRHLLAAIAPIAAEPAPTITCRAIHRIAHLNKSAAFVRHQHKAPIMPAINFKAQFADDVEWGHKRQTVRAHRKDGRDHAKVGDRLKLYTGMRTKSCRLLGTAKVTRIDTIWMDAVSMKLNGKHVFSTLHSRDDPPTDNEFAQADGFDGFTQMANWFEDVHGLPFEGVVIHWNEPQ